MLCLQVATTEISRYLRTCGHRTKTEIVRMYSTVAVRSLKETESPEQGSNDFRRHLQDLSTCSSSDADGSSFICFREWSLAWRLPRLHLDVRSEPRVEVYGQGLLKRGMGHDGWLAVE